MIISISLSCLTVTLQSVILTEQIASVIKDVLDNIFPQNSWSSCFNIKHIYNKFFIVTQHIVQSILDHFSDEKGTEMIHNLQQLDAWC